LRFLAEADIKGIVQPIVPYRVLEESTVQNRFEVSKNRASLRLPAGMKNWPLSMPASTRRRLETAGL
jgi:hypothetical protein